MVKNPFYQLFLGIHSTNYQVDTHNHLKNEFVCLFINIGDKPIDFDSPIRSNATFIY